MAAFRLAADDMVHDLTVIARRPDLVIRVDGRDYRVTDADIAGDGNRRVLIDGQVLDFVRVRDGDRCLVRSGGRTSAFSVAVEAGQGDAGAGGNDIVAPMPGVVVAVHKAVGDPVRRGETVVTIESMKLQVALAAPRDGRLAAILCLPGAGFARDQLIASLTGEDDA